MAKPTRTRVRPAAPARQRRASKNARKKARTPARKNTQTRAYTHAHLPVSRRYSYTPELLAEGRRRYERTEDRIVDIAADFGVHKTTFQRLANDNGWVRYAAPPRDLSRSAKVLAEVEAGAAMTPTLTLPLSGGGAEIAALPDPADTIDRLHRVVLDELATVEAMRARMKAEPETPAAADVTARTLARHTQILQTLQRMRCGLPETQTQDTYDDDMPADIDAFRDALARRIRAFVESRSEPGGTMRDDEPPLADAARP